MIAFAIIVLLVFGALSVFLIKKGIRQGDALDAYQTSGKAYVGLGIFALVFAIGLSAFMIVNQIEINNMYDSYYDYSDDEDEKDDDDDDDYVYTGSSNSSGSSSSGSFTNKFGTRTTKCAVSGCSNYIAKSGDTNCCTTHSNKCGNCYCYIDGDAMYCMSCLSGALSGNNSSSSSSGSSSSSSSSHECYICGDKAYSKYGSYYYCSDCLALVKAFSD